MGLALLNEAVGKSIHADFAKYYQGYIDVDAPVYQLKLLHAVKVYNANHV